MQSLISKSLAAVVLLTLSSFAVATPTLFANLGEITSVTGTNPYGATVGDQLTISGCYNRDREPTASYTTYLYDGCQEVEIDLFSAGPAGSVELSGFVSGTVNYYTDFSQPELSFAAGLSGILWETTIGGWRTYLNGGAFTISNGANLIEGSWIGPANLNGPAPSVPTPSIAMLLLTGLLIMFGTRPGQRRLTAKL